MVAAAAAAVPAGAEAVACPWPAAVPAAVEGAVEAEAVPASSG